MRKSGLLVAICVILNGMSGVAQATDLFQYPFSPSFTISESDAQNYGIATIWGIFDSGVDRFAIYEVVGGVEQANPVAEDDDPLFDTIDQWSWDDATYLGWQIGVYHLNAYDASNNLLDRVVITVEGPPMM